MRKVQIFAVISAMAVCMFSVISLNTERVYADGDIPCITSSVYSVDEGNSLIGELQSNTVQADAFKSSLSASPQGAAFNVYANDGITPKTGFIVSGDKVKVSYNGLDKVYTVETYSIVNGEKIYPGYVADTSMGYAVPGDDAATDKPVPIGFNFNYFGNSFNSAYIDINGFISFNSLAVQKSEPLNYSTVFTRNSVPYNIIAAFLSDITVQNISENKVANPQYVPSIYYKTIGVAPNRQFIVQWTNMYFWQGSIQFADLQVILNEGSDKILLQYRTLLDTGSLAYGVEHLGFGGNATVGLKGPAKADTSSEQISYMIGGKNSTNQSILLHQGQAISFAGDGKGGYTMVDSDAQYEKVYLQNPLAPSVSLISESAGMIPDKAVGVSKNAKIGWQGSALAERYRLAVATTETFSNILYNIDGIKDTYFQFDDSHPLQSDTAYYWKVESINNNGSSFSPVYSFTTGEDSALSNLSSDAGTWNTPFTPGTTEYTINVPYGTSGIAFTPTAVDASSVIKVNGDIVSNGTASKNITLNAGSNTIVILVTAPNSNSKTYTITVNHVKQPAPDLTGFTWAPGNVEGTTQATTTPSGILMYIVGAEGSEIRPNVGDSADAYKDTLSANTDIAVNSGDHIYIASVDASGNAIAWTDVAVSDADIKTHQEPTPVPDLTGFTWAPGSAEGTTQAATTPSGILMYIVGAEGSEIRPNVGDSADAYKDALSLNTDIAVNSGDHIYIVSVDTSGSAIAWTDVTVSDADIKTHQEPVEPTQVPDLTGFTWTPGNAEGTTQAVTTPSGILMYIVGAEGSETRPNAGDSADAYKDTLSVNTDIAVNSGDHIYIVSVNTSGSTIAWTDVTVSDTDIKMHQEPTKTIYSVLFNSQGGSTVTKISNIISGTSITEPAAPTRSGYTFNGWYKESGCINKWKFDTDIVTHNVILYAGWTSNTTHDNDYDDDPKDTDTPKVKDSVPVSTTVKGSIIDNSTGTEVSTVPIKVTTDSNGNSKITLNASQIIVLKKPDGEKSALSDESKVALDTTANIPITMKSDGTVQISNLSKGTESKLNITYDLGGGQKIIIGTIDIKVDSNGNIDFTSSLIDPYGTLTDSLSGEVISNSKVTLYYADTDRNKSSGKKADTVVELPEIEGFKPNNNKNPQTTDINGTYGFMVYPNTDYYMVVSKDGYDTFKSPVIAVGNELVKYSARLNPPVNGVKRIAGDTRIDTAIQLAKSEFKKKVDNVILSTADNYPDALSGSVLAYQQKAPILLVGDTQEDKNKVLEYMKDNVNPAGNVYILGGTGAVGEDVVKQIKSIGFANTVRLGGTDRYETSAKIANYLKAAQGTPVILVSGRNYPDALSVSSPGAVNQYPILLVNNGDIDNSVKDVLASLKPSKIYIIGNQGVIRDNTKNNLEQITALKSDNIVRIGGDDRYKTSAAIAKYFNLPGQSICVTTGRNFPDALAGSIYAANFNAPVILVDSSLNDDTVNYIKDKKLTGVTVFGGDSAISKDTQLKLLQIIGK